MLTLLFITIFILITPPIAPVGETLSFLKPNWTNDYYYDLITCGVFWVWIKSVLNKDRIVTQFQLKIEKVYYSFLIVGIIPIIVGYINENSNLLYAYRFFFYFAWVPAIMQLFQNEERSVRLLKIIVGINFASIVFSLINHFHVNGLTLGYLDIEYAATIILCFVILSTLLNDNRLFQSRIIGYSTLFVYFLAISIDLSRKNYIALLIGTALMSLQILRLRRRYVTLLKMIIICSIILIPVTYQKINEDITIRLSSIFYITDTKGFFEYKDSSIAFRSLALEVGIEKVMEHPLIGVGTGYDEGLTELLMVSGKKKIYSYEGGSPHNFFISSMRYYGIPVVLFLLCNILILVYQAWKYTNMHKIQKYNKIQSTSIGMIIGYISYLCILSFTGYGTETTLNTWLFLGMITGLANQINENKAV